MSAHVLWKFCRDLRFVETAYFPCKRADKYNGDLQRRRIRTRTAQKNIKILAGEIPYVYALLSICNMLMQIPFGDHPLKLERYGEN